MFEATIDPYASRLHNAQCGGLGIFGSVARGEETMPAMLMCWSRSVRTHDLRQLVCPSVGAGAAFHRRVDLVTEDSLSPYLGPRIRSEVSMSISRILLTSDGPVPDQCRLPPSRRRRWSTMNDEAGVFSVPSRYREGGEKGRRRVSRKVSAGRMQENGRNERPAHHDYLVSIKTRLMSGRILPARFVR